jgi:hypothetical protein
MRVVVRLVVCALVCVAALVGGAWAFARWQRSALADLDLPGAAHCLMSEIHRREALDAQELAVSDRLAGKQEVIYGLLDGRLSLREAGDEFRRLNAEKAETEGKGATTDQTDACSDEAVYGSVLGWIDAGAATRPQWVARAAQLRAEVNSMLHRPLQGL